MNKSSVFFQSTRHVLCIFLYETTVSDTLQIPPLRTNQNKSTLKSVRSSFLVSIPITSFRAFTTGRCRCRHDILSMSARRKASSTRESIAILPRPLSGTVDTRASAESPGSAIVILSRLARRTALQIEKASPSYDGERPGVHEVCQRWLVRW